MATRSMLVMKKGCKPLFAKMQDTRPIPKVCILLIYTMNL